MTPKNISIKDGKIKICPEFFKNNCTLQVSKRNEKKLRNLKIVNNVDLVRSNQGYYLHVITKTDPKEYEEAVVVGSVDFGIRTLATVHSNNLSNGETFITEYKHRVDLLKKLNNRLKVMKGRIRKIQYTRIEKKKKDIVDKLHWDFINHLLSTNDVIYLGDIKSHDIVKHGKNKHLNSSFNDLKFYQLKQRLLYKAFVKGKRVILVKEHYTTKTCSCCGTINNNIGSKEVFDCSHCEMVTGRDINASKNMKLKGLLS